ncbi:BTAD domain-containing putative transcriptional regulator [Streptomyces sp. NPDC057382]|uniref:AfsR/SARP family transcriptional regulator n=1 Tax=unclassified Streptomyces TaxID=2593676 RepID=UPI00363B9AE7
MQFRILGAVDVWDEQTGLRIVPTGAKQRALLATLVVRAGQHVSAHRLVDELWGDHPPADAANALYVQVARLRRLLSGPAGRGAAARAEHPSLVTTARGYALGGTGVDTDAARFRHLADQGRRLLHQDPERACELLRRALSLWRGPALAGAVLGDICAGRAAQLEEDRLVVLESMYDACLRAGRHGEITGELVELTTDHPLRERFYALLMVAFHRCGRQAEALGVYERARGRMVRELGVEPGPALRGLRQAVLRHDPSLTAPTRPVPGGPPAAVDPATLAETLALYEEIALLNRRIEQLQLRQHHLLRRFAGQSTSGSAVERTGTGQGTSRGAAPAGPTCARA